MRIGSVVSGFGSGASVTWLGLLGGETREEKMISQ